MALLGATKLINTVHSKFYIEVGEDMSAQIYKIFNDANYQCFDPVSKQPIDHCITNTLFIPK
jgi:hypothetical protein